MTAQISDTFIYKQQNFNIAEFKGTGLFEAQQHGLNPVMLSTACYRGYVCIYEVIERQFLLQTLYIGLDLKEKLKAKHNRISNCPKLFEILPKYCDPRSASEGNRPGLFQSAFVYDNLKQLIPIYGKFLIATDFIQDMYVHLGFQSAYKYRTVWELFFDDGKLIDEIDRSEEMELFRQKISQLHINQKKLFFESQEWDLWKEERMRLGYDNSSRLF